jgi:single-strand DNA-binding protein
MNNLNFTGNCGRDAEVKHTASGDSITSFSVALSSGYGDRKVTTWINCSMFGKRGEAVANYVKKGSLVGITGEFQARPWTNKDGVEKLSLEVRVNDLTLLGSKADAIARPAQTSQPAAAADSFDDLESIPF